MTRYARRSTVRLLLLVVFLVFYLILGATLFSLIEGPLEEDLKKISGLNWIKFLRENPCLTSESGRKPLLKIICWVTLLPSAEKTQDLLGMLAAARENHEFQINNT